MPSLLNSSMLVIVTAALLSLIVIDVIAFTTYRRYIRLLVNSYHTWAIRKVASDWSVLADQDAPNYRQQVMFLKAAEFAFRMYRAEKHPTVALVDVISNLWAVMSDEQRAEVAAYIFAKSMAADLDMTVST